MFLVAHPDPMLLLDSRLADVAERLLPTNFDLTFRLLHVFGGEGGPTAGRTLGKAVSRIAARLAQRGDMTMLMQLLGNFRGTLPDQQWDQVCTSLESDRMKTPLQQKLCVRVIRRL